MWNFLQDSSGPFIHRKAEGQNSPFFDQWKYLHFQTRKELIFVDSDILFVEKVVEHGGRYAIIVVKKYRFHLLNNNYEKN